MSDDELRPMSHFELRMSTWTPEERERERHARELGQSWCSACWSDHAPDVACVPRVGNLVDS